MDSTKLVVPDSGERPDPVLDRFLAAQAYDAAAEFESEHDPRECDCNNLPSPCVDCRAVFERQRAARPAPPLSRFTIVAVRRSLAAGIRPRQEDH